MEFAARNCLGGKPMRGGPPALAAGGPDGPRRARAEGRSCERGEAEPERGRKVWQI